MAWAFLLSRNEIYSERLWKDIQISVNFIHMIPTRDSACLHVHGYHVLTHRASTVRNPAQTLKIIQEE